MSQLRIRSVVWTSAIAAVTATGAWYGAGLKTRQELDQTVKKTRQATATEKIAQLEEARAALVGKEMELERKLEQVRRRKEGATREETIQGRERRRDVVNGK